VTSLNLFDEPVAEKVTTEKAIQSLQCMRALLDEIERSLKDNPRKLAADALESDGKKISVTKNAGVWEVVRHTTTDLRDASIVADLSI
jgi:hypothetical protein